MGSGGRLTSRCCLEVTRPPLRLPQLANLRVAKCGPVLSLPVMATKLTDLKLRPALVLAVGYAGCQTADDTSRLSDGELLRIPDLGMKELKKIRPAAAPTLDKVVRSKRS